MYIGIALPVWFGIRDADAFAKIPFAESCATGFDIPYAVAVAADRPLGIAKAEAWQWIENPNPNPSLPGLPA
jgi:hypothetical protein